MSDPTDLLRQLSARSEKKLRSPKNMAKGSWLGMDNYEIRSRIHDEINELIAELDVPGDYIDWEAVADEAADVYHFAGMGADPKRKPR